MSNIQSELTLVSSEGYKTSEAGKNVIDDIFPKDYTRKNVQKLSLDVKSEAKMKINGQEVTIVPDLGLYYSSEHKPLYELIFLDGGIDFYYLASY